MTARRFLRTTFLTAAVTVAAFMAVTIGVDPYDYWGQPRVSGVNAYKPLVHTHMRAVKSRQYLRAQPRTVLAGNSRVDVGIDPQGAHWPPETGPVYNFGMPGSSLAGVTESLATLMAEHRPERVFLGVDFLDFIVTRDHWAAFRNGPLVPAEPTLGERARRFSETTLSVDALLHAGMTVMEQGKEYSADTRPNGFTPLENYHELVQSEGHAALFEQRSRELVQRLLRHPLRMDWDASGGSLMWLRLEQFLQLSRAQGVEVVLFTYPYHSDLLETLRQTGKWPELRAWHARLTELAAREGVTLWSFTGYDGYSTEAVPQSGDTRTRMQWYWEAGHFKPALGALMVQRMLELPDALQDFGRKLTPGEPEVATASLESVGEVYRERTGASSVRIASYVSAFNNVALKRILPATAAETADEGPSN